MTIFHRTRPSRAPRNTSRLDTWLSIGAMGLRVIERSIISGMAKKPMVVAMMGNPPQSSTWPKVNRSEPVMGSRPTVPNRIPAMPAPRPFSMAPRLSADTITTPNIASAVISGKLTLRMTGRITGMMSNRAIAPTIPPMAETA